MKAAILGAGVIGQGWAVRFAAFGWDVAVFDADPKSGARCRELLARVQQHVAEIYADLPSPGRITQVHELEAAVTGADWIQESLPETLAAKHAVYEVLAPYLDASPVGSSTSGFRPSVLAPVDAPWAGHVLVCHPFNPVYLLPLVEVVAGERLDAALRARALDILRSIGMRPLVVRKEIDAHIADRLLEAVWREALWLVKDGVATTEDIDVAITHGFGLRWAQMGLFETYRLGGGAGGMAHFLAQFGPALTWPWSRLTDVPELDDALIGTIVSQSDAQTGDRSTDELAAMRDANLVALIRALRARDAAAGAFLNANKD